MKVLVRSYVLTYLDRDLLLTKLFSEMIKEQRKRYTDQLCVVVGVVCCPFTERDHFPSL